MTLDFDYSFGCKTERTLVFGLVCLLLLFLYRSVNSLVMKLGLKEQRISIVL